MNTQKDPPFHLTSLPLFPPCLLSKISRCNRPNLGNKYFISNSIAFRYLTDVSITSTTSTHHLSLYYLLVKPLDITVIDHLVCVRIHACRIKATCSVSQSNSFNGSLVYERSPDGNLRQNENSEVYHPLVQRQFVQVQTKPVSMELRDYEA